MLVVSTTRVSPSQRPMESPIQGRTPSVRCLAFRRDDARVVDHLDLDGHRVRGLHELIVVVVEAVGQHRRAGVAAEADDAALAQRAALRVVELTHGRRGAARRRRARPAVLARRDWPLGVVRMEVRGSPSTRMTELPGSSQPRL